MALRSNIERWRENLYLWCRPKLSVRIAMIAALILAVHVLAPYEWTGWTGIPTKEYSIYCDRLLCSIEGIRTLNWIFMESRPFGIYASCDKRVTKQEFDARITKWRDQGFPRGICEGKPIS